MASWYRCAMLAWLLLVGAALPPASLGIEPLRERRQDRAMHAAGSVGLKVAPLPPTEHFERPLAIRRPCESGIEVPRYPWGSFGARYRYHCGAHWSYYGDFVHWCFRPY